MNCIKPCDKQPWLLTAEKKGEQREKEKKNKDKKRKVKGKKLEIRMYKKKNTDFKIHRQKVKEGGSCLSFLYCTVSTLLLF